MVATLIELELTAPLLEVAPSDPLGAILSRRRPLLHEVVDALRTAAGDPDVAGLLAHVGGHLGSGRAGPSLAQIQELRDAVRSFGATGKPAVAWTETFGEFGPGTLPYYLATAFDQIWLQPSGDVGFTGVAARAIFAHDALEKLGVVPQVSRRHEYKNAADTVLETGMTPAHREATGRVVASVTERMAADVGATRGLPPLEVRELSDRAPLSATEARSAGLVDRLGYRDEVYAELHRRLGPVRVRYLHRYHHHYRQSRALEPRQVLARTRRKPVVAVVHAVGDIHLGRGARRPSGSTSIGAESLGAGLRAAAREEEIRAVVLRVDSGGGSYVASDAIRRDVLALRASGRPVVVSMGTAAASGGYFIAMPADTIVAQPGTLTGSIGVFGGKAVIRDLLAKVGISRDAVAGGRNAAMFSSDQEFTEEQWRQVEAWLDRVYDDFTAKVASDRGLSRDVVEGLARGRVWTGADAYERGLVDELGGRDLAVELACARLGLGRADVTVRGFPRLPAWERLRPVESSEDRRASVGSASGSEAGPLAWLAGALGVPRTGVLTAPVLWDLR